MLNTKRFFKMISFMLALCFIFSCAAANISEAKNHDRGYDENYDKGRDHNRDYDKSHDKNRDKKSTVNISYAAHCAGIGWQSFVRNREIAGTTGQNRRMEALEIRLGNNSNNLRIRASAHVAGIGWMNSVHGERVVIGTTGEGRRMEAIKLELVGDSKRNIVYRVHVSGRGWLEWVRNGRIAGTVGESRQIEAVQIYIE